MTVLTARSSIDLNARPQLIPYLGKRREFSRGDSVAPFGVANRPLTKISGCPRPLSYCTLGVGDSALNPQQRKHHLRRNAPAEKHSQGMLCLIESIGLRNKRFPSTVPAESLCRVAEGSQDVDANGHDDVAHVCRFDEGRGLARALLLSPLVASDEESADDGADRSDGLHPRRPFGRVQVENVVHGGNGNQRGDNANVSEKKGVHSNDLQVLAGIVA